MKTYIHSRLCAAFVNGCQSRLIWEDGSEETDVNVIIKNRWGLDHGKWVCPAHPGVFPAYPVEGS